MTVRETWEQDPEFAALPEMEEKSSTSLLF